MKKYLLLVFLIVPMTIVAQHTVEWGAQPLESAFKEREIFKTLKTADGVMYIFRFKLTLEPKVDISISNLSIQSFSKDLAPLVSKEISLPKIDGRKVILKDIVSVENKILLICEVNNKRFVCVPLTKEGALEPIKELISLPLNFEKEKRYSRVFYKVNSDGKSLVAAYIETDRTSSTGTLHYSLVDEGLNISNNILIFKEKYVNGDIMSLEFLNKELYLLSTTTISRRYVFSKISISENTCLEQKVDVGKYELFECHGGYDPYTSNFYYSLVGYDTTQARPNTLKHSGFGLIALDKEGKLINSRFVSNEEISGVVFRSQVLFTKNKVLFASQNMKTEIYTTYINYEYQPSYALLLDKKNLCYSLLSIPIYQFSDQYEAMHLGYYAFSDADHFYFAYNDAKTNLNKPLDQKPAQLKNANLGQCVLLSFDEQGGYKKTFIPHRSYNGPLMPKAFLKVEDGLIVTSEMKNETRIGKLTLK